MPTEKDKQIAKGLGTKMLSDDQIIQQRWEAMYKNRKSVQGEEYIFKLPVSVRRLGLMGNQTYSQNIIWNKSLLLQLFRANFIKFLGLELESPENPEDEPEEWAKVEVNFLPARLDLGKKLAPYRKRELEHFNKGFTQLEKLLSSKLCVSRILKELYEVDSSQRVCGGCRFCRDKGNEPTLCPSLLVPERAFISKEPKGTIVEGWPDPTQPSQEDDFAEKIEDCCRKNSLKPLHLYCPKGKFEEILGLLEGVFRQYRKLYRIDPFSKDTVLRCYGDSPKLFLHFGVYNEDMLKKAQEYNSNHFFCGIQNPNDPNGRHIKWKYKCDSWSSPEVWLQQLN
jgi:hypothetical protein